MGDVKWVYNVEKKRVGREPVLVIGILWWG